MNAECRMHNSEMSHESLVNGILNCEFSISCSHSELLILNSELKFLCVLHQQKIKRHNDRDIHRKRDSKCHGYE